MIKLIAILIVLATGQTQRFTYVTTFDTRAQCEAARPQVEDTFYAAMEQVYGLTRAEIDAKFKCVGEDDGIDPYGELARILDEMNRRGGFGHLDPI